MSVAVMAPAGMRAQDDAGEAFCGLLTTKEIRTAFNTKVEAAPGYGSCDWYPTGGGDLLSLSALWSDMTMADTEAIFEGVESVTVAGRPALYSASDFEAILFVDIDPGILMLDAVLTPTPASRAALVQLGELAVGRVGSLPEPPDTVSFGPEPSADPVAAAFCGALTAEEVTAALGAAVDDGAPAVASGGTCEWVASDPAAGFVYLSLAWATETLDEKKGVLDGTDLEVGGRPAWFTSALGPVLLYVALDQGLLTLAASVAEGVDGQTALSILAEAVVARSASLPGPPVQPVAPTPVAGGELEGRFPASVGGQPLTVQVYMGESALANLGPLGDAVGGALTAQGFSLADVSVGIGMSADFQSFVLAVWADGLDAEAALGGVLETLGGPEETAQIAGKTVSKLTNTGGAVVWFYAADDVIWMVQAQEPALSELVGSLP